MMRSAPIQRRTPMNRGSGFKRGTPAPAVPRERAPVVLTPLTRRPNYAMATAAPVSAPKRVYVRSKALREAYRLIPCQHCFCSDGTVCCAHSNLAEHGKGKSIKASDDCAASLCFTCHTMLDQGSELTREERRAMFMAAYERTVVELKAIGHWPVAKGAKA